MTTHTAEHERAKITNVDRVDDAREQRPIEDVHFELALWVRGLECFCSIGDRAVPTALNQRPVDRNFRAEFQTTRAVLIKCGELVEEVSRTSSIGTELAAADLADTRHSIQNLLVSNNALARNSALNFAEWNAWCETVADRLARCEIYRKFESEFERQGRSFLPERLKDFIEKRDVADEDRQDLRSFLPRFAGILRSLEVVRRMLATDTPLKPSLAIFAFVYEAIDELIFDINERLSRRADESSECFGMLDGASYTLRIETKKVFSQELAAVIGMRSATAVFARIESAFGLLNDNIQQLLAGFLRLAEPDASPGDLFAEFNEKLERSIELRSSLWSVLRSVRQAETDPSENELIALRSLLDRFNRETISFLFYKDRETFERFSEEIAISPSGNEAGPILHRFSAYAETLFNQVGMRAVLSNHPFSAE